MNANPNDVDMEAEDVSNGSRKYLRVPAVVIGAAMALLVVARRRQLADRLRRFLLPRLVDVAWDLPYLGRAMTKSWDRRYEELQALEMQPGDIVMLGDSITEFGDWQQLLPGVRVHNHGIGGDDTYGVLRRLDLVTRAQPGTIFLMIGTNDLGKGTPRADIVENAASIVDQIRREVPTAVLHVQSILPRWRTRTSDIEALNVALESVATSRGAFWVDLRPRFDRGDGTMDLELSPDALHLNAVGYARWAEDIQTLLETGTTGSG
jgi:lysophospholipase L1-like esterase